MFLIFVLSIVLNYTLAYGNFDILKKGYFKKTENIKHGVLCSLFYLKQPFLRMSSYYTPMYI